uniref:Uncharacterized protein n=1 Tax=Leersia perrieri TaxID=77586 RepID=A0A0D9XQU8_9ORYZ
MIRRASSSKPAASSASKPRRPSPSPSPSPVTAPKTAKNVSGGAQRRRSPLSDLNSGDASAARPGCFRFLVPSSASASRSKSASATRTTPTPVTSPKAKPRPRGRRGAADQESRTRAVVVEKHAPVARGVRREGSGGGGGQIRAAAARGQQMQMPHLGEALTPQRKAESGNRAASGATPPIHASISPEVLACGSATPACFAAGHHVVPGVGDRRKCRPRGILAIAGEGAASEEVEVLDADPSRASIRWLSSPSGTCSTKCANEDASVNWLPSPREERPGGVDLLGDEIFVPRCSLEDAFWQFSPDCTGLLSSPVLGGLLDFGTPASELSEMTPSSGFLPVQKTPSTGDSISPFSLIVKRASQSLSSRGLKSLCSQQGLGSTSFGSTADLTAISGESWNSSKCSGLTRTCSRPLTKMDPVVECLEMMTLSPRPRDADYCEENVALPAPLPELSFQFAGAPTPLESIDLTSFKRSPCGIELKEKKASFQKPVLAETRISWREGLVSRMFDMGDLDCCKWLSDDEDGPVVQGNDEALRDTKIQPVSPSCVQECGDQIAASGFGSVEFDYSVGEMYYDDRKPSLNPIPVAESMTAEGFELVLSDDSDWTLLYKNGLFET